MIVFMVVYRFKLLSHSVVWSQVAPPPRERSSFSWDFLWQLTHECEVCSTYRKGPHVRRPFFLDSHPPKHVESLCIQYLVKATIAQGTVVLPEQL